MDTIRIALVSLTGILVLGAVEHPGLGAGATWEDGRLVPGEDRAAGTLDGAELLEDVPYLDETRDTPSWNGDKTNRLEYRTRMNVYIPSDGKGPFPAILFVHGGSYTGGGKDRFPNHWAIGRESNGMQMAVDRGYVAIAYNYILGRGIHPQVQRDFKECIRHLRAHADRYRIDPNRIAAIGSSAGGWLVTSAGLTTADDFGFESKIRGRSLADWPEGFAIGSVDDKKFNERGPFILTPFDELRPRHPELSSRINALVFDFAQQMRMASPDDPVMLTFKGQGAGRGKWDEVAAAGDLRVVELSNERTRGKPNFHLPDPTQPVASATGSGTVTLNERWLQFLDNVLRSERARTPAAEARPNARLFQGSVAVSFATAAPGTAVHYTLDGSDPTTASPRAEGPISLRETTRVRFIAVAEGMRPSGVATAHFIEAPPLPEVTGPEVLPVATVGEPYEVSFAAEGANHWFVNCQNRGWGAPKTTNFPQQPGFAERRDWMLKGNAMTIGLAFDTATGTLGGTPNRPGTYTLQVCAARDDRSPGGFRTWTLVVRPE